MGQEERQLWGVFSKGCRDPGSRPSSITCYLGVTSDQPPLPRASCRSPDHGLRPLKPWAEQTCIPCKLLLRYFLTVSESWLSQASHPGKHWPRPCSVSRLPSCVRTPFSMVPLGCLRNFHSLSNSGRFPRGTDNICSCCHCIYVQISMDYI